jgi:hypothetical protein
MYRVLEKVPETEESENSLYNRNGEACEHLGGLALIKHRCPTCKKLQGIGRQCFPCQRKKIIEKILRNMWKTTVLCLVGIILVIFSVLLAYDLVGRAW